MIEDLVRRIEELERQIKRLPEVSSVYTGHLARACTGAGQSIPNGTGTATIINYGTVTYDPRGLVTTGANWRFTAEVAGYYEVATWLLFNTTTTWAVGEVANVTLFVNGTFISELDRNDNHTATASYKPLRGTPDITYLAAGGFLDVRVNQASGGALTLYNDAKYNWITVKLLS